MSQKTKASELAMKVLNAKSKWEDERLQKEQAIAECDYAEKVLILSRKMLELERSRLAPDDDWHREVTQGYAFEDEILDALRSVELVGELIGVAAKVALAGLSKATVEQLVMYMRRRGFQFSTDSPAREIHGALLKQPWAHKKEKTNLWYYVIGG